MDFCIRPTSLLYFDTSPLSCFTVRNVIFFFKMNVLIIKNSKRLISDLDVVFMSFHL